MATNSPCKSCGMVSRTPGVCEWCGKREDGAVAAQPGPPAMPLNAPPAHVTPGTDPNRTVAINNEMTQQMQPVTVRRRVSLTGEVVEEVVTEAPAVRAQIDHVPATAWDPAAVNMAANAHSYESRGARLDKALAICVPVLAVSMLLIRIFPAAVIPAVLVEPFLFALILGATGAIPPFDNDVAESCWILAVCMFFGPLTSLVVFGIVSLVRQEWSSSALAMLLITLLVPNLLVIPLIHSSVQVNTIRLYGTFAWLTFFTLIATYAGWLFSSFFRNDYMDF